MLDLDATDDPLHGHQEGRFFHGYYDCYCYLPLYVFCGRHLLAAKLRRSNIDASAGAVEEMARIVAQIRRRWPRVRILLRADSGFAREALMAWCEANRVDFVFGLARNERLDAGDRAETDAGEPDSLRTGKAGAPLQGLPLVDAGQLEPQPPRRRQGRGDRRRGQSALRRHLAQAAEAAAQHLYEAIYCARGEMENRIKECQLDLFADRTSAATMRANQLRLWFASMAYVLLCALRRIGLAHTQFADATCGTIRLKLLKIGAWCASAFAASRSPWPPPVPGSTSSRSPMRDCETPPPDTNQTPHSQHTSPSTLPDWRCCSCATQPSPQTSARPFSPYRRLFAPPRRASTLRRYENSGLMASSPLRLLI